MIALAVAIAGAGGAIARAAVERAVDRRRPSSLPLASYLINPLGSFALGITVGLGANGHVSSTVRAVVGTGFWGAFTVVGPLTFDTLRLALDGKRRRALGNLVGGVAIALAAATLGLAASGGFNGGGR